jgi:hypothetical protein
MQNGVLRNFNLMLPITRLCRHVGIVSELPVIQDEQPSERQRGPIYGCRLRGQLNLGDTILAHPSFAAEGILNHARARARGCSIGYRKFIKWRYIF